MLNFHSFIPNSPRSPFFTEGSAKFLDHLVVEAQPRNRSQIATAFKFADKVSSAMGKGLAFFVTPVLSRKILEAVCGSNHIGITKRELHCTNIGTILQHVTLCPNVFSNGRQTASASCLPRATGRGPPSRTFQRLYMIGPWMMIMMLINLQSLNSK